MNAKIIACLDAKAGEIALAAVDVDPALAGAKDQLFTLSRTTMVGGVL